MPRRPCVIVPNTPHHIIQRGNNRQACFYAVEKSVHVLAASVFIWLQKIVTGVFYINVGGM